MARRPTLKLVLAEKPQVARDLARVLQVKGGGGAGCFEGEGYVITWCIGHLIELEEPAAYDPAYKRWSFSGLPILPERFQLRPSKGTVKQWRVVRELLRRRDFTAVINACDAGREGELIFRFCYELSGSILPIERLWISSLTEQAIRAGLDRLRPGGEFSALADAARCRAEADWLVGMNATRAVTLSRRAVQDVLCSVGRVQTPTLALLVRRERQIQAFVPQDYFEVRADLSAGDQGFTATWRDRGRCRLRERALAEQIAGRSGQAADLGLGPIVESVESKEVREPPPLLFDLTSLQRTANRRFGFSAQRTLQLAQSLYERHKLITYPRTDSRTLTSDLVPQLPRIFEAIGQEPAYAPLCEPLRVRPPAPPRRVFQDGQARDHHAIIPTAVALTAARSGGLDEAERQLLDLIVRRFLGAFYPDAVFEDTGVVVRVGEAHAARPRVGDRDEPLDVVPPPPDRYEARGRVRLQAGWQEAAGFGAPPSGRRKDAALDEAGGEKEAPQALPKLREGQVLAGRFRVEAKRTRPPPRYSEATLLSAMESAGQHFGEAGASDDEALRQEMKDLGLGTPATRAAIIETLLNRGYAERQARQLLPTPLGIDLIEHLPVASLAAPELTGRWEARLARIARGEELRSAFMADIVTYVRELVEAVRAAPTPAAVALLAPARPPRGAPAAPG